MQKRKSRAKKTEIEIKTITAPWDVKSKPQTQTTQHFEEQAGQQNEADKNKKDYLLPISVVIAALIIAIAWVYSAGLKATQNPAQNATTTDLVVQAANLEEEVLPALGVELSVKWGDLGKQMVETGVIDAQQFEALYSQRGGLNGEIKNLLYGADNKELVINQENASALLNLLWAFGLGNKNEILEKGPMMDPRYGGAGNFASTGGWTLAKGGAMNHYSKHQFIALTSEQQQLVERVSKNIYRPCCDNSTYFPDCNHGMAMLGLLELMAAQGVSEDDMYRVALQVNAYWFPNNYFTIAKMLENQGIDWLAVNPREVLSKNYSSASGYRQVLQRIQPANLQQGGGCGV